MTPQEWEDLKQLLRRRFVHLGDRWDGGPSRSGVIGTRHCAACGKRSPGHLTLGICNECFAAGAPFPENVAEKGAGE